jgi:hypothetical protein
MWGSAAPLPRPTQSGPIPPLPQTQQAATMSIWNKVLLGLIAVASLGFLYLGMRTLKTEQNWREFAQKRQDEIAQVEAENQELQSGKREDDKLTGRLLKDGIEQVEADIKRLTLDRGRVWRGCAPGQANPQTGQVAVTVGTPDPHGIAAKTVLYVFEEKPVQDPRGGGSYLGEFKVTAVAEAQKQVVLEPTGKPATDQLHRLAQSAQGGTPWTMYEVMPADNYWIYEDMLAGMNEDERRAALQGLLPTETVEEYVRHGQKMTWDDVERLGLNGLLVDEKTGEPLLDDQGQKIKGVQGRYERQLRDYALLFDQYDKQRTVVEDMLVSAQNDLAEIKATLDDANRQVAFRQQEVTGLKADLAKYEAENEAVASLEGALSAKLQQLQGWVTRLMADNRGIAAQIAQIQLDAARRVDERTRAMAQAEEAGR